MNNELIKEVKGKTYHFKFKSKKIVDLEKITGKSILEVLQDTSFSNVARLLKYSCIEEINEFELLDDLLEEMTYEEVIMNVIIETCVVSGLISKKQADDLKKEESNSKN